MVNGSFSTNNICISCSVLQPGVAIKTHELLSILTMTNGTVTKTENQRNLLPLDLVTHQVPSLLLCHRSSSLPSPVSSLVAVEMSRLLKAATTLITHHGLIVRHVGTNVGHQESASLVGVGAVDPLAVGIDDGALDVVVGEVELEICQILGETSWSR